MRHLRYAGCEARLRLWSSRPAPRKFRKNPDSGPFASAGREYYKRSGVAEEAVKKKRILVAEDDESIATMLVRVLTTKYEVHRAVDGRQAVALAQKVQPQLLLLDVMMPGLDGYGAAQQMRLL